MWYDKGLLLSHNKLLNMVLSNRGGGKTFNMTRWCIDDFKKTKKQAMWVRRYQTEVDEMLENDKFFKAILPYYPNDKFEIKNGCGYVNGELCIWFVALSTSRQLKSNNYPDVNKLIYDEFIIDKGRVTYIKNEPEVLLDLIETVDRMRDEVRCVMMANSISIVNPYFTYFNIKPNRDKRFTIVGEICVELFTDTDFIDAKNKTRFGKLVKGTRYGDYAVNNQWLLDNEVFIMDKTPNAEFMLGLKYNNIMYGFWVDYKAGYIFVNRQYDPSSYQLYCLQRDDHETNLLLVKSLSDSRALKRIVYAFQQGLLRFSDMQVKNQFYEFIGNFVR